MLIVFNADTIYWFIEALKPLIYGLILAYLLDSLVCFLVSRLKIRRSQGILLSFILMAAIILLLFYMFVPKIVENINAISSFFLDENLDIVKIVTELSDKIDNQYVRYLTDNILHTSESMQAQINSLLIKLSNSLMKLITNIGSKALSLVTSIIISIYMLIEKDDILARGRRFIFAYFNEKKAEKILQIFKHANVIFKSYLNGKIIDSFIVGVICVIAFSLFGVPYAPFLGTLVGAFNMIPYFGPIIGTIPVVVVSFLVKPAKALTAIIIVLILQQIDGNYLDPKIVGGNIGVSPFWVITAVTVGGNLFGIAGLLFSVPLTVLIKTVLEESIDMRLMEKGMSELEKDNLRKPNEKKKR